MLTESKTFTRCVPVTPSDTVRFGLSVIFVGGTGNIVVVDEGGNTTLFTAVAANTTLPGLWCGVNATSTTATAITRGF